jgi:imidazoleglycerol phosphate synthase glutamine amidotransferase subunit HisH
MIVIVDYGAGNLSSVRKAFDHLGAEVTITGQSSTIDAADKIVLPGVGHFSALSALNVAGRRGALLRRSSRSSGSGIILRAVPAVSRKSEVTACRLEQSFTFRGV